MNANLQSNLIRLKADLKNIIFLSNPKRLTGNSDYFSSIIRNVISTRKYDLGDSTYLINSIVYRLHNTHDKNGRILNNFGYKQVLVIVERSFITVNNK